VSAGGRPYRTETLCTKSREFAPDIVVVLPIVRRVAADTGAKWIDLFSVSGGRQELYSDRLHPTADGAQLLAKAVYDAIV